MAFEHSELPLDAEEAFLQLEERYRRECDVALREAGEHDSVSIYYTDYIAQVLGAAEELGLTDVAFSGEIPSIQAVDFTTYQNFSKRVKHYTTRLQIRHGRRLQGHSVSLDHATRDKVKHLLSQVFHIFNRITDERKREALLARLADLEAEVNRVRTRFDSYAALAIEIADVAGEIVDRSKIIGIMDGIARMLGRAKKDETQRQLPAPTKPKQIEFQKPKFAIQKPTAQKAPPTQSRGGVSRDIDDEIPF